MAWFRKHQHRWFPVAVRHGTVQGSGVAGTQILAQTLGRLVTFCRIDGKVEIVENVQGTMAMAVVPILIEITA